MPILIRQGKGLDSCGATLLACRPPKKAKVRRTTSTLTDEQAYAAMYYFLDQFYLRTKSDDVGGLLGSMSLLSDGFPADRAIVSDWREAVKFALDGGKAGSLELKGSLQLKRP